MSRSDQILLSDAELKKVLTKLRKAKKKIVLTQGVFDMVHIGHARYLETAKTHGDILIVGVDSDDKVRHRKGPDRPVVPQDERMEMLAHLAAVDYVFLKPLESPKFALLKIVQPDVLIATEETYTADKVDELKQFAGQIEILKPQATTSTSAKLRLLQIGAAKKISATMSAKLVRAIEEVLAELKGEE